jgi:RNA polymerase sigma-70 factor (ECF subfamily)
MTLRDDLEPELPRLRAQARRLCLRESDAQDLVQDTVLRALAYEHSFTPGTNLRAWLQQIQRSVFVSGYRRRGRERRALDGLAADPCSWPHRDAPPAMSALTVTAQGALELLPDPFRRVVELVDLGGLEYRDAALTLEVPVGTVMSRLHRARRLLATRLADSRSDADTTPRAA